MTDELKTRIKIRTKVADTVVHQDMENQEIIFGKEQESLFVKDYIENILYRFGSLDDLSTNENSTWSSTKILSQINDSITYVGDPGTISIFNSFGNISSSNKIFSDDTTSSVSIWSASKIASYFTEHSIHNNLSGINGGDSTFKYHLSLNEYTYMPLRNRQETILASWKFYNTSAISFGTDTPWKMNWNSVTSSFRIDHGLTNILNLYDASCLITNNLKVSGSIYSGSSSIMLTNSSGNLKLSAIEQSTASDGDILIYDDTSGWIPSDISILSSGDVFGDSSSVDRSIAVFDGIDGKHIVSSSATIDSSGNIAINGYQTFENTIGVPDSKIFSTITDATDTKFTIQMRMDDILKDIITASRSGTGIKFDIGNGSIWCDHLVGYSPDWVYFGINRGFDDSSYAICQYYSSDPVTAQTRINAKVNGKIYFCINDSGMGRYPDAQEYPYSMVMIDSSAMWTGDHKRYLHEGDLDSIISPNLFSTISASGQEDISASSSTDTLTFVAGNDILIETDSTTNSVTISYDGTNNIISSSHYIGLQLPEPVYSGVYNNVRYMILPSASDGSAGIRFSFNVPSDYSGEEVTLNVSFQLIGGTPERDSEIMYRIKSFGDGDSFSPLFNESDPYDYVHFCDIYSDGTMPTNISYIKNVSFTPVYVSANEFCILDLNLSIGLGTLSNILINDVSIEY